MLPNNIGIDTFYLDSLKQPVINTMLATQHKKPMMLLSPSLSTRLPRYPTRFVHLVAMESLNITHSYASGILKNTRQCVYCISSFTKYFRLLPYFT